MAAHRYTKPLVLLLVTALVVTTFALIEDQRPARADAPPAPTGKVVFLRNNPDDFSTEIWTIERNGTGLTRLTTGHDDQCPSFSPTGQTIVFDRPTDPSHRYIWEMAADGSGQHQVSQDPPYDDLISVEDHCPTYSYDGATLRYQHTVKRREHFLCGETNPFCNGGVAEIDPTSVISSLLPTPLMGSWAEPSPGWCAHPTTTLADGTVIPVGMLQGGDFQGTVIGPQPSSELVLYQTEGGTGNCPGPLADYPYWGCPVDNTAACPTNNAEAVRLGTDSASDLVISSRIYPVGDPGAPAPLPPPMFHPIGWTPDGTGIMGMTDQPLDPPPGYVSGFLETMPAGGGTPAKLIDKDFVTAVDPGRGCQLGLWSAGDAALSPDGEVYALATTSSPVDIDSPYTSTAPITDPCGYPDDISGVWIMNSDATGARLLAADGYAPDIQCLPASCLSLLKVHVVANGAEPPDNIFTLSGAVAGATSPVDPFGNGGVVIGRIKPGLRTVHDAPAAGWVLAGVLCVRTTSDGSTVPLTPIVDLAGSNFTVSAALGDVIDCTATHTLGDTTNHPPLAVDDEVSVPANTGTPIDVRFNDSDPDGDVITLLSASGATHGSVSVVNGRVVYTPTTGYSGDDAFDYVISDPYGATDSGHVVVHVSAVPCDAAFTTVSVEDKVDVRAAPDFTVGTYDLGISWCHANGAATLPHGAADVTKTSVDGPASVSRALLTIASIDLGALKDPSATRVTALAGGDRAVAVDFGYDACWDWFSFGLNFVPFTKLLGKVAGKVKPAAWAKFVSRWVAAMRAIIHNAAKIKILHGFGDRLTFWQENFDSAIQEFADNLISNQAGPITHPTSVCKAATTTVTVTLHPNGTASTVVDQAWGASYAIVDEHTTS